MISYKDLYNVIKAFGYTELLGRIKIDRVSKMIHEVDRRIDIINLTNKENKDTANMLNVALADVDFNFRKISEEELVIADKYKQKFDEVRKEFLLNIDKDDYKYISLFREYNNLFTSTNFEDLTTDDMNNNTIKLDDLMKRIHALNESNSRLLVKYLGDEKYVKIHKRVMEKLPNFNQVDLHEILIKLKNQIDDILLRKFDIMDTESYFKQTITPMTIDEFEEHNVPIVIDEIQFFTEVIVETYLAERSINL